MAFVSRLDTFCNGSPFGFIYLICFVISDVTKRMFHRQSLHDLTGYFK